MTETVETVTETVTSETDGGEQQINVTLETPQENSANLSAADVNAIAEAVIDKAEAAAEEKAAVAAEKSDREYIVEMISDVLRELDGLRADLHSFTETMLSKLVMSEPAPQNPNGDGTLIDGAASAVDNPATTILDAAREIGEGEKRHSDRWI